MNLNQCIERVEKYLDKDDNHPRVVNFNNIKDLNIFKEHFNVVGNEFLDVSKYSLKDENPSIDKLFNYLSMATRNIFVTEFTTYMKLRGEEELNQFLNEILHSSFYNKVIIVCYQCERNLQISDGRTDRFIYKVCGEYTRLPKLFFVQEKDFINFDQVCVDGIENVSKAIETNENNKIYIKTKKRKNNYIGSLYKIVEENSPYKILCNKDIITKSLDETIGNSEEWSYALKKINEIKSWRNLIDEIIGSCNGLENFIGSWKCFDEKKRWIYFVALKIYGSGNNWCLNKAVKNSNNKDELIRNIYRCLLTESHKEAGYWDKYFEWKRIIISLGNNCREINDYCQMVKSKGNEYIYYITDNTIQEKQLILEFLDSNANEYNRQEILEILSRIFPDLYDYLSPYRFNNDLLDKYFQDYKYQKVVNKIFPGFRRLVEEQARKRDFNLLPPRASKIESINKEDSALYFIDAMGVEFLSYIIEKCKKYNLFTSITICRCELPSLTEFNKEFIKVFKKAGATLISGTKGIKQLDKLKHEGIDGANYETTKLPIHLISELEVIDKIIRKIDKDINQGDYSRAVIVSDHGTSRLTVINEIENKWEMKSKGQSSGRCCPMNEIDEKPEFAIEENKFWVLANYDRFRGGRKSDVEVHGGASLEEVVVPIIEIRRKSCDIEIKVLTDTIQFNVRKKNAHIKIFSKTKIYDVIVEIDGNRYKGISQDNQTFDISLPNLKKAKEYEIKVFSGCNLLANNLKFVAEKEGFKKRKLF